MFEILMDSSVNSSPNACRTDRDKMREYRKRYLEKRLATETPEEQAARLQKARDNWAKRWSMMSEEERERHRARNRNRHRQNKLVSGEPTKSDVRRGRPTKRRLVSAESDATAPSSFGDSTDLESASFKNEFKMEDLFSQRFSTSDSIANLNDMNQQISDLLENNCEIPSTCQKFYLPFQNYETKATINGVCAGVSLADALFLRNEAGVDESMYTSTSKPSKASSMEHVKDNGEVIDLKDESSPLGEMVVNIHRKLRQTGLGLEAAIFKKNVMNLIAECEFTIEKRELAQPNNSVRL